MLIHHHPKTLSALTPTEQTHLANLLTLPSHHLTTTGQPSKTWLTHQFHLIADPKATPRSLRRASQSLIARFLGFVTTTSSSQRAVLCPAHRGLNSRLVRAVFGLLVEEVDRKARPLRRFVRHPGRYHLKEGEWNVVCGLVERLADVEGLWHGFVESGCNACILAIVGGDEEILRDLWAVVVGRTHRRRPRKAPLVFGGLVAAWIENLEDGERVTKEAEALGSAVKRVRWAVSKHRRERRSIQSVSKRQRKAVSGRGRTRDSGYGSAAGNGGDSAAWKPADDLGATLVYRSSSSLSREKGQDGCDDDEDPFIQTTVKYDVILRKKDMLSLCQPETLGPNISTHTMPQDSTTDEQDEEYDVFLRERSTAAYHYQQPHASDASSSSSILHIPPLSIPEEGDDKHDADDDDSDYDEDEPEMWYRTLMQNSDAEFDPVLLATSNLAAKVGCSESLRSDPDDGVMDLRPLTLGLVDSLSQKQEPCDSAQWTDVTVATRDSRWRGGGVAEGCGSSSVYSTTGTAVPHPPVLAASTVVGSGGRLQRALASRDGLAWAAWPNPFADAPPIATITYSNSSQRLPRASPSSSSRTVASTVGGSITTAALSPDDFHHALDGLDDLSIVHTPKGNTAGIPEGTVLPWESISAVGRCSCTAQLEIWREGIPCDQ